MQYLADFRVATLEILVISFFLLTGLQTFRVFSVAMCSGTRTLDRETIYEGSLAVHLMICTACVLSVVYSSTEPAMDLIFVDVPLSGLLWFNLVAAVAASTLLHHPTPRIIIELVLLVLMSPPLLELLGETWPLVVIADAVYFAYRLVYELLAAIFGEGYVGTHLSITDALNRLPEGIVYLTVRDGRVLFMNDTMRSCLISLGLPTDLADARGIWPTVTGSGIPYGSERPSGADRMDVGYKIGFSDDEVRFFTRQAALLHNHLCICIIAYDITEEDHLQKEVELANMQLSRTMRDLVESLENIESIAANEARLRMRSRVHDIIGQRLSILHRHLEDDAVDKDSITCIEPLLTSILDELDSSTTPEPALDLESILNAFGFINVTFEVTGALPSDPDIAQLFIRVIREASTNAVRHGQARSMMVSMGGNEVITWLDVSNDGRPPVHEIAEGSGIKGMRRDVERLGGDLTIAIRPRFALSIEIPNRKGER